MRQYSPNGFSRPGHVNDVLVRLLKRGGATITALGLLTIGALIAGCGGGGSSGDTAGVSPQVVSGTAATGAPLVGQVSLRDSSSRPEKGTTIGNDGLFAIDVSDMTAPFILKATGIVDGVRITMFSFADKPGTANINPLSTVLVARAAVVDDPATVFEKHDAAEFDKIKSAMPGTVTTVQSTLKPLLLGFNAASVNPVTDDFKADHTGLDDLFDNVKITLVNGTLTITNAITGVVIFTAQVKDIEKSGHLSDKDEDLPKHSPRLAAPTNVKVVGGDARLKVSWDAVANATSYDLFYATKSKLSTEEDNDDVDAKRVRNVTSPFVLEPLAASTTYSVIVRAINNGRRGTASAEVSATTSGTIPAATVPAAPTGLSATGGTNQATITWAAVTGATSYNLYWLTTDGVTTANGTKISAATSPTVQTGLADSTKYFYVLTAVNSAGESAASVQVAATTLAVTSSTSVPAAPTSVTATAGANQATLSWTAVTGADSYNVYWSTTSGFTTTNGTRIAAVTSPFVHTGLSASTAYFYIVTAVNSIGESGPSIQVTATTNAATATVPAAPTGVVASGGAKQVSVSWTAVSGATSYNLYWSLTTGVTIATGTKVTAATNSNAVTGLADGTAYFLIVTAVNGVGESLASSQATATTNAAPPPALDGVAIYNANCSGCHGTNGKRPRTALQITNAIASVGDMQGISLTQAEIAAIAARP